MSMFKDTYSMRGAMLLDADTLERLEPDQARGIRATYMDAEHSASRSASDCKNHFQEAIVLASKVISAPHIIAELCMSDDPDYVTGYIATRSKGYMRITKLKPMGCPDGGRIFLYRGASRGCSKMYPLPATATCAGEKCAGKAGAICHSKLCHGTA